MRVITETFIKLRIKPLSNSTKFFIIDHHFLSKSNLLNGLGAELTSNNSLFQNAYLVLPDQVLSVDPRMIFLVQLGAILAFPEEDLSSAWMHFGVFCHIVHYAFVYGPAVVFGCVLADLLGRVEHLMRICGLLLQLLGLLDEFLQECKDCVTTKRRVLTLCEWPSFTGTLTLCMPAAMCYGSPT
jgi:hypothetical protein